MSCFINTVAFAIFVSLGIIRYASAGPMIASANVYQANTLQSVGTINFTQDTLTSAVHMVGTIRGLPQSVNVTYGFHIHSYGTLDNSCKAAGGHYNPTNVDHGAPWNNTRHVGDLGNINRTNDGSANVDFWDSIIKLTGPYSIVGRSLVIHTGSDDYGMNGLSADSRVTGNAGERWACGIVGVVSDFNQQGGSSSESVTNNVKLFTLITVFVCLRNVFA